MGGLGEARWRVQQRARPVARAPVGASWLTSVESNHLPAVRRCWQVVLIYKTIKLDAARYSQQAIKDYYGAIWCAALAKAKGFGSAAPAPCRYLLDAACDVGLAYDAGLLPHSPSRLIWPSTLLCRRLNFYCEYLLLPFLAWGV